MAGVCCEIHKKMEYMTILLRLKIKVSFLTILVLVGLLQSLISTRILGF